MVNIKKNPDFFKAVEDKAEFTLGVVSRKVAATARGIVPVRTGTLKDSIEVQQENLTAHIGSNVHYAAYVEAGTSKQSAQPYLRPALMENLSKIKRAFKTI